MILEIIKDTPTLLYVGNPECRMIGQTLQGILALASSYVAMYDGVEEKRLFVGSGQSAGCSCPGNPAHNGFSIDLNYYTQNLSDGQTPNATHYIQPGMQYARIWDGETFIPERFHFRANWDLFNILYQQGSKWGRFQYRTSELLIEEFKKRGYKTTGMVGDFQFNYEHHIHAHIDLQE